MNHIGPLPWITVDISRSVEFPATGIRSSTSSRLDPDKRRTPDPGGPSGEAAGSTDADSAEIYPLPVEVSSSWAGLCWADRFAASKVARENEGIPAFALEVSGL